MTIKQLTKQYQQIEILLSKKLPIADKKTRIFAKTVKIMEELGEFCQQVLVSQQLHRHANNQTNHKQKLDQEFADVLATLILIGIELDIDIEQAITKKLVETKQRLS